jgi:hypothetical protein
MGLENECTDLKLISESLFLGTKAGMFTSSDNGRSWNRAVSWLGKSQILAVTYSMAEPNFIYASSVEGVYRTKNGGQNWEKVFTVISTQGGDGEQDDSDNEQVIKAPKLRSLLVNNDAPYELYLATSKGVYRSLNEGDSWEPLTNYGLLREGVRLLYSLKARGVLAVTNSGIFENSNNRWYEISLKLNAGQINSLVEDKHGNIYAACEKGLFKTITGEPADGENNVLNNYEAEPDIKDIQRAAIKYAEVDPEKIQAWRRQAAKRAILPQFNVGLNRNVTDLWHWESGSTAKSGDDALSRGHDALVWDVGLSWDLGELIWNNDQTSIDTRSKLMVELREDILDQVTKLYFERLRTKMDLDYLGIEDRKKRREKELRILELSASLDALTGGYFTKTPAGK